MPLISFETYFKEGNERKSWAENAPEISAAATLLCTHFLMWKVFVADGRKLLNIEKEWENDCDGWVWWVSGWIEKALRVSARTKIFLIKHEKRIKFTFTV